MSTNSTTGLVPALCRIWWMFLGPILLILITMIVANTRGWLTTADLMFAIVLLAILGARWLEFQFPHPLTADGDPAAPFHLQRFLLIGSIVGLSAWIGANIVANRTN